MMDKFDWEVAPIEIIERSGLKIEIYKKGFRALGNCS